jgi:hypothetical protein
MHDHRLDLPPISRATLTPEELLALFQDLRLLAQIEQVGIRTAQSRVGSVGGTIDDAERGLISGAAAAVQIRYRHEGQNWLDTLQPAPGGFALVRMQQKQEPDKA